MTRGNFLLITDTANWMSIQFNGDMYPSCNGKFVYHMLESVETYDDLAAAILKFDEERFGYADMHDADLAPASISDDIDFSKDYFAIYNSDYLYIKNASNKDCTIIAKNGVKQTIKPGEIQIWNYGNLVALDDEVLEELELDDKFSAEYVRDILATLHNLEWFEIQNPDGKLCSIDGMLYSRNGKLLYFCPRQRKGTVIIPDGTETICQNAFSVTQISELIIPASVKRLQKFACGDNNLLKRVIGGEGIVSFGQYAFYNCVRLTEFNLGKNVKFIGNSAFANTELKTIDLPEGLKSVGDGAFHTTHITEDNYMVEVEPDGMYEIHIPNSLRKIGLCAFSNASVVYTETVTRKLLIACTQSGNRQTYHAARFWRLKVKDKPELILPKTIDSLAIQEINDFVNTDGGEMPHLYKYGGRVYGGYGNAALAAALEHCRLYPDKQVKTFLTQHAAKIADVYADEAEELVKYIQAGVFSDTALKKMMTELEANKKGRDDLAVIKGYLLNAIKPQKSNFCL